MTAATSAATIPTISLQALMRIQNQRRRKIGPDPAPMSSMRSNAVFALFRSGARRQAQTMKATIAARVAQMSSRSPACGRTKRR